MKQGRTQTESNGKPTKEGTKTEKEKERSQTEDRKQEKRERRKEINRIQPVIVTGLRNRIWRP